MWQAVWKNKTPKTICRVEKKQQQQKKTHQKQYAVWKTKQNKTKKQYATHPRMIN